MPDGIKYHMDEHAPTAVTTALRARGVDVVTSQGSDLVAASDEEHLVQAAAEGRVIFTQDADFLRLHAKGLSHTGIVYAHQQTPIGDVIRGLMLIYRVLEPSDMHNHVEFL